MKKVIAGIVCVVTLLFVSMVYAEEKLQINVGVKGWYNSWEVKLDTVSIESDSSVLMLGPSITLKSGEWFGGISYLTTMADYEFNFVGDKLSGSRSDLDIMAGYMFHPRVGILAGYKYISSDLAYTSPWGSEDAELTLSGPVIGITANYPIENTPISLFGSLSYLFGESEFTMAGVSETDDVTGTTLDLGVAYAISEKVSANVGYKHQSFEGDEGGEEHIFSGLTFGLNYAF